MKTNIISKEHFHSFNALRFFSFFVVFLSHLPYSKFNRFEFLHLKGSLGVYFFFILSGFLITYIILNEKKQTQSINLKRFFYRRIIRIWPLYFAVLLFAYFSSYMITYLGLPSSNVGYEPNWLLSFSFLENYAIMYHSDFANVSPLPVLWTVCIEEHFYIIWGITLLFTPKRHVLKIIITYLFAAYFFKFLYLKYDLLLVDVLTNMDYFMFGALPAYFYVYYKERFLSEINRVNMVFKISINTITICYIFSSQFLIVENYPLVEAILIGFLFSSLLIFFLPKINKVKIHDTSLFSKLGIYTYSLYIVHTIATNFLIQLFAIINVPYNLVNTIGFIIISLLLTLFLSSLTYHVVEKPFLKLKKLY